MRFQKYPSRLRAGEVVAEDIKDKNKQLYNQISRSPTNFFCFAIPNGGVPIAEGFCSHFNIKYDILIVRKVKIPYNTEAGFGSVTTDGTVLINETLLSQLNLSEKAIEETIDLTKKEIKDRLLFYNKKTNITQFYEKQINNRQIFILDDGLASGFTMLAAINMISQYDPEKIFVAVPTAPLRTIKRIKGEVNEIFCPNIREVSWFAVADAYQNWYDLQESEVLEIINKSNYYLSMEKSDG
ncbi:MAG: phosphoribosyltransferase [Promethearchaeota archaeon]|jgi:predicted phosphoribosyltransferase